MTSYIYHTRHLVQINFGTPPTGPQLGALGCHTRAQTPLLNVNTGLELKGKNGRASM